MIGVRAARRRAQGRRSVARGRRCRHRVRAGQSGCGVGPGRRLADDVDAVEDVTNGPVSSEQPFLQPVAAGPTNVGDDGPKVVVLAACARTVLVLPLAAGAPPRTPTSSTESDNSTNHLRMMLLRMRASQHWARRPGRVS